MLVTTRSDEVDDNQLATTDRPALLQVDNAGKEQAVSPRWRETVCHHWWTFPCFPVTKRSNDNGEWQADYDFLLTFSSNCSSTRLVFEILTYVFGHKVAKYGRADKWVRFSAWYWFHGVSYWCSVVTVALKCTVLGWGHETDRRRDRWIPALLSAPSTLVAGHNNT